MTTIDDRLYDAAYAYDGNDRLLTETKDAPGTAEDTHTVYVYGSTNARTEQTGKTVHQGLDDTGAVLEQVTSQYNLQGRLGSSTVDKTGSGGAVINTSYTYNDSGIRTSQTVDGQTTTYVIDVNNPTGYAQVLDEHVGGQLQKRYVIGLDVITQTDIVDAASNVYNIYHFEYDGHGSNRALLDTSGSVVQRYAYDAYGNAVGFDATTALTTILYCGEHFDVATDQLYLRARYYDAAIGQFKRSDDFTGDPGAPQSLHKYLYVHANPIMGIDPTGRMGLVQTLGATGMRFYWLTVTAVRAVYTLSLLDYAFPAHPADAPYATYQARLDYLTDLTREMQSAGDAYARGGYAALNARYATNGFHMRANAQRDVDFPDNWGALSQHMGYMLERHTTIGQSDVAVSRWMTIIGAGINDPFKPGLTLDHEFFWGDEYVAVGVYLHEGFHNFSRGGLGHDHMEDIVPVENNSNAYDSFCNFALFSVDDNDIRLLDYIRQEAARRSAPPQRP